MEIRYIFWIGIKVISVIIAVLIVLFFVLPVFGFDLIRYISAAPLNTADISQPIDLSTANQFEGFELSYDGMILGRSGGEDNITKILEQRVKVIDCSSCSPCTGVDLNQDGTFETYNCQDCDICNGTNQPNRFKNCINCDAGNCKSCDDTGDEYLLCKEIKKCILDYYGDKEYKDKHGCFIDAISRIAGVTFNIDDLKAVLGSCKDESIKVNMGNNISKELCYFNASSIASYDFELPSDFYINYKIEAERGLGGPGYYNVQSNTLNLVPFYKKGEETFDKYRVYVAINATPQNYTIKLGKYDGTYGLIYDCEVGKIETDSTGFGYGKFTPSDCIDEGILQNWKSKPESYPLNGVDVSGVTWGLGAFKISVIFYADNSESNGVWSNDLRYSNCNFNTNP